jgi:p-hydroxybenzoate 3-monooxygenase
MLVHQPLDPDLDPLRRRLTQARLDRLFESPTAGAAFADIMAGIE